jgi:membrane protein DedA with SNARE-associated domain
MLNFITELFNHYGYLVLFVALTLELIAFPNPGETLMTYCGFLVFQGKLNWIISIIVATSGVISGITISYFIGRALGYNFIKKYGPYVHLSQEKWDKTSKWLEKYGNGLLVVAYFIPGIRHITGYFSGASKIPYKKFAIYAYTGALIWTGTFISLGKILGLNWNRFHGSAKRYLVIGGIITAVVLLCIYLYKSYKYEITEFVVKSLENLLRIFHSLGKIKIVILGMAVAFIGLSILVVGLIQDFLANEFSKFDTTAALLIKMLFPEDWSFTMRFFSFFTSYTILIFIAIFILMWIVIKGKSRFLEARFLFITLLGGEILEELLRLLFHRIGPLGLSIADHAKYTFPSEQSFMALVTYGFAIFIILRHINRRWIGSIVTFIALAICIFSGLSPLFFQLQFPSDVTAGYVFGGVWLSMNIVLLEVFRILPDIEH